MIGYSAALRVAIARCGFCLASIALVIAPAGARGAAPACVQGTGSADTRDPPLVTGDARVDGLLGRMTLADKLTLIHDGREDPREYQGQAGYIGGIARLGIPGLRLADGPPGVLTRVPAQA